MPHSKGAPERLAPKAPLWWYVVPIVIAIVLIAIEALTDLDRSVSRYFLDPQTHSFPLRHDFVLEVVMHRWAKWAVITLAALVAAGVVLTYVLPPWKAWRR